jgi:uncharacterized protein YcnI
LIEHVQRELKDKFWQDDRLQEEYVDEFVIRTGGSEDNTSSDNSSEESSDECDSD